MSSHDDNLCALLREHGLSAGFVVAVDGTTLAQVGDPAATGAGPLSATLLGSYGDARTTFESLEGRILPRIWAQGDLFAFVDRPTPGLMVIVFGRGVPSAEQYDLSQRVAASIRARWTENEGAR